MRYVSTSTVFFTIFRTNCCAHVLVIRGKVGVSADEEPKNKQDRQFNIVFSGHQPRQMFQKIQRFADWLHPHPQAEPI
jgi:hypothetical protein